MPWTNIFVPSGIPSPAIRALSRDWPLLDSKLYLFLYVSADCLWHISDGEVQALWYECAKFAGYAIRRHSRSHVMLSQQGLSHFRRPNLEMSKSVRILLTFPHTRPQRGNVSLSCCAARLRRVPIFAETRTWPKREQELSSRAILTKERIEPEALAAKGGTSRHVYFIANTPAPAFARAPKAFDKERAHQIAGLSRRR